MPPCTLSTLHPPPPPTVHHLSRLALLRVKLLQNITHTKLEQNGMIAYYASKYLYRSSVHQSVFQHYVLCTTSPWHDTVTLPGPRCVMADPVQWHTDTHVLTTKEEEQQRQGGEGYVGREEEE